MILRHFPKNMAEFIEMFGTEEQCRISQAPPVLLA